jgi:hypothetical protein
MMWAPAIKKKTMVIKTLSARGSKKAPTEDRALVFSARYPSRKSVKAATKKSKKAKLRAQQDVRVIRRQMPGAKRNRERVRILGIVTRKLCPKDKLTYCTLLLKSLQKEIHGRCSVRLCEQRKK